VTTIPQFTERRTDDLSRQYRALRSTVKPKTLTPDDDSFTQAKTHKALWTDWSALCWWCPWTNQLYKLFENRSKGPGAGRPGKMNLNLISPINMVAKQRKHFPLISFIGFTTVSARCCTVM